jgi:hypothetical protein
MAPPAQHSRTQSATPDFQKGATAGALSEGEGPVEFEEKDPVLQELEDVCSDPEFQSSQRNCEFLRFVVLESLSGRGTDLRERTLGVELFGRSDTYDTSADAVVRVRANDVRKRLIRHYEKISPKTGWQITLPPRSYQAVFTRHPATQEDPVDPPQYLSPIILPEKNIPVDPRHLTWRQLLTPTLFALVVCATMFRWQAMASNPFMTFWSTLLTGKSTMNLVVDSTSDGSSSIKVSQLRGLSPLISVASLFKVNVHFSDSGEALPPQDPDALTIHLIQTALSPGKNPTQHLDAPPGNGNGVLVELGPPATLWLEGQGQADIDREIQDLTDTKGFPIDAAEKVQQNASYFIPLDQNMQLASARHVSVSPRLQR